MAKELLIIVWLLFGHSSEQPLGQDETYPEFGIGLRYDGPSLKGP